MADGLVILGFLALATGITWQFGAGWGLMVGGLLLILAGGKLQTEKTK